MFVFVGLASAITYVGEQTTQISVALASDLLVEDCIFQNIGGLTSYTSPLHVSGGSGVENIEIISTFFQNTRASNGGTFHLQASAKMLIYKTATQSTTVSAMDPAITKGQRGACGLIWATSSTANINLSSFVQGQGGSTNLELQCDVTLDHGNSSQCNADRGLISYAYGNVYIGESPNTATVKYTTFYKDTSSCAILYFYYTKCVPNVVSCNFLENTLTGYGLITSEGCSQNTKVDSSVFQGNNYNGHEIFSGYSAIDVINCVVDNTKTYRNIGSKNWVVSSTQPIRMELYATRDIIAAYTAPPTPAATEYVAPPTSDGSGSSSGSNSGNSGSGSGSSGNGSSSGNSGSGSGSSGSDSGSSGSDSGSSDSTSTKGAAAADSGSKTKDGSSSPIDLKVLIGIIGGLLVATLVVAVIFSKVFHKKNMDEEISYSESAQSDETDSANVTNEPTRENLDIHAPNDEVPDAEAPEVDA